MNGKYILFLPEILSLKDSNFGRKGLGIKVVTCNGKSMVFKSWLFYLLTVVPGQDFLASPDVSSLPFNFKIIKLSLQSGSED